MQRDDGDAKELQHMWRPKPTRTRRAPIYLEEYACNAMAPETVLTPCEVCCIGWFDRESEMFMPTAVRPFPVVVTAENRMRMVQKLEIRVVWWNSDSYNFVALARLPYEPAVYNDDIPSFGFSPPSDPVIEETGTDLAEA